MKLATRAALGTAVVALAAQTAGAHRSSFTPAASRRELRIRSSEWTTSSR